MNDQANAPISAWFRALRRCTHPPIQSILGLTLVK